MYAKGQVKDMRMVGGCGPTREVSPNRQKPDGIRKIQYTTQKECEKGAEIAKKYLGDIRRASTG